MQQNNRCSVWCPYKLKYGDKIEKALRRAIKFIPGLKELTYEERLRKLHLPTVIYGGYREDMIKVYKLVH